MNVPIAEVCVAEHFRWAMRHVAATVTVISTETDGTRYGMTATAVVPVSMEPPSILATIYQNSFFHRHISRKGAFCVNLLSSTVRHSRRMTCLNHCELSYHSV